VPFWQERREQRCWEKVKGGGSYTTRVKRYTRRKVSGDCFLRVFKKTRLSDEAFEDLYENTV
jgi:hypothetical protein